MPKIRTIIRGIINGEYKPLKDIGLEGKTINSVYTILNEKTLFTKYNTETGEPYNVNMDNATIIHHMSVFVEDIGHDWNVIGDNFKFFAHSSAKGAVVDLFIDYE